MEKKNTEKKNYEKPVTQKHKSVAMISGSSCSLYNSKKSGSSYYH